ncbi:MAG: c-type cytochrome [Phycisphaerales bacterium]|nr:MAG: c-type cytochrome [Phycisphaerales bacterium]
MSDRWRTFVVGLVGALTLYAGCTTRLSDKRDSLGPGWLAPADLCASHDDASLLILGSEGRRIIVLDRSSTRIHRTFDLPAPGSGLAVHGHSVYVTAREPAGRVFALDRQTGAIRKQWRVGHTPTAPVISPGGRTLCVANRFDHTVTLIDLATDSMHTANVVREPIALVYDTDGKRLFVANHLPEVKPFLDDENPHIAAEISVIDVESGRLIRNIELPNGSQGLRGIAISPNGRHVVATHILSHWTIPPTEIQKGAMNMNALSLVDTQTLEWVETIILDDPDRGAANPWAVTFSSDGRRLLVTHAGTHELSVIDFAALRQRVAARAGATGFYDEADLTWMADIRRRVPLGIHGARALLECDGLVYAPGYFSDDLAVIDLDAATPLARVVALAKPSRPSASRLGERYFNDATLCFQHWQSCASCHPDGRNDTLYWDLLNDGMANTKNTKSLLMSALTPPVMWRGVRADAATAVRAGIHHIQFAEPEPEQAQAIDAYLLHMKATPGPSLDADSLESPKTESASCAKCHYPGVPRGTLTEAARRGQAIFEGQAGCSACHPHPTFTSGKTVDPGLGAGVLYDVPSLIEVWRTAPYLHSGDALTLRETITDFNWMEQRGRTKDLSEQELDDLLAYLRSL